MKYKIINHENIKDTVTLIAEEILNDINVSSSSSIICPWYKMMDKVYNSIFNLEKGPKEYKKNIPRVLRKKIVKEYQNIKLINMYDFIGSDNLELSDLSTYDKFLDFLNPKIEFCSFRDVDQDKINKELLINPSDFDRTIKTFSSGRIGLSVVYIDKDGEIPFIENYVENIGTNLTSIEDAKAEELKAKFNIKKYPEQTINCGNRCLTKSHKIIALIESEALKFLTNEEFEKTSSASIKTLREHDNVTYVIKSW